MGNNNRFAKLRERLEQETSSQTDFWSDIKPHVSQGIVIPIVSNAFHIEQIFREEGSHDNDDGLPTDEALTTEWANWIKYPMQDKHNLARVAQYYLVEQKDSPHARTKYLEFLKTCLLAIASDDQDYADLAGSLESQTRELSFSEIAYQLDYPRVPDSSENPLRLLARFPLPIYITTGQNDFLERALEAEGKKPRTQICFWSGEISSASAEHKTDPDFTPSVTNPLVYHLYGLEDYPQTLVMSEDDYINFLIAMVEDTNTLNPVVPLSLRRALGESHILLLGYRLQDWDFRVLFRFIQKFRRDQFSPRGLVIQLNKNKKQFEDTDRCLDYLGRYFDKNKFDIQWNSAESFIQKLWEEWNAYRKGQS